MEPTVESEHTNNLIPNLSKQNLIDKYYELQKLSKNLQAEEEEKDQQIHNCKRELTRLKSLEVEYVCEIESLQAQKERENEKFKLQIQDLENKKNNLKYEYAKQIERLEQSICKNDEQISKLQNELESTVTTSTNEKVEIQKLHLKIAEFKNVIHTLEEEIIILKDKFNFLEKQNLMDMEQKQDIQADLDALSESCQHIQKEIDEIKRSNESLQEDLTLSKQELETVKNEVLLDGSQGNSLFAEVDNKTQELQKRMILMESRYSNMKGDFSKLVSEIATLSSTNTMLCQKWESVPIDNINEDEIVEQSLKEQINLLETQLDACINEILKISTTFKPGEIQFMENMLEVKNKEFVEALREGEHLSQSKIVISCELRESNQKMRNLRAKAAKYEFEIEKLRAEINDLTLKENQAVVPLKSKKSLLKDAGNAIAYLNSVDDGFSMVDYSRQLKRSRLKSDRYSKTMSTIRCEISKMGIDTREEIKHSNNVEKKVNSIVDIVKCSEKASDKSAVAVKHLVLKKKC